MSYSEVQICNMALSRIGIDIPIASLDTEQSKEAAQCRLHYEQVRDAVLADFPWNFAKRRAVLAELADTVPPGWQYNYALPTDCLRAVAVIPETGDRYVYGVTWGRWLGTQWDWDWPLGGQRIPYQIESRAAADGTGRRILTDEPNAHFKYIARIEDLTQWSPQAIEALYLSLAHKLCMPMRIDDARRRAIFEEVVAVKSMAAATSMNEMRDDPKPLPEALRVRA